MSSESVAPETENIELCRRYVEEFANTGDETVAVAVLHEDVLTHQLGIGEDRMGRDALVEQILSFREAVPDWHLTVEDVTAQDDRVMFRLTARGTPKKAWRNLVPTGRSFEADAFFAFRVEDGRIVEQWNLVNLMGISRQLGMMPPTPRAIAKMISHRLRSRFGSA
ncbi:ester cyclase [Haloferax mediterranei ATCC 33500]|uniref:Ester cyclase n=1 Tax=Haloferax mediterranei (strain ATCC 33500 / DSM 1411 / JCM 8866 / NBRC 14739 / NCIMB 2177 / R-4) TaxID=523841 RepID=I3R869_HALMT|nr:ester cyclase [Haloferax mediterranei]AFK20429.1 protein of unknown function DUF1486 [Haloferax mediterranei ATCC 33500]AHZ23791.1 hypothetical protein BM92_14570 [Haloferax mediterranei ATCC 33500]ELZ98213.1 hypothetical protein C439_15550 [Haloferax mediterranei ATCC 33500]MDX5986815.1 ester cyclase [Haloferax mediterranei ATCC 33500]QCQ76139.1 ester cyclase [Haloferax mediterranei ATCC 33500]